MFINYVYFRNGRLDLAQLILTKHNPETALRLWGHSVEFLVVEFMGNCWFTHMYNLHTQYWRSMRIGIPYIAFCSVEHGEDGGWSRMHIRNKSILRQSSSLASNELFEKTKANCARFIGVKLVGQLDSWTRLFGLPFLGYIFAICRGCGSGALQINILLFSFVQLIYH